jgi:hypothetical protein
LLPLAGCCIIGLVGLAIATVIICSLIPLYLNYRAVTRSAYSVKRSSYNKIKIFVFFSISFIFFILAYSLSNVDFARYYNGKRHVRMLRSTQSVIPTAAMIQGFQDEVCCCCFLKIIFDEFFFVLY